MIIMSLDWIHGKIYWFNYGLAMVFSVRYRVLQHVHMNQHRLMYMYNVL
jgi:hypothetical protein